VFVVPGRQLVLKLKENLANKKQKAELAKQRAREQREEIKATKAEVKSDAPPIRLPKLTFKSNVDENQLRSFADTAGEWLVVIGRFFLAIAIFAQLLFTLFSLWSIIQTSPFLAEVVTYKFALFVFVTAIIWACYYLVRVQLGMVAAVILIERNTRPN